MLQAAITLAATLHARLMFPGNVYNFGANMPAGCCQTRRSARPRAKGPGADCHGAGARGRRAHRGVQSVVIRAGEFIGGGVGNWFDNTITKSIGRAPDLPGRGDVTHAWAYLPDLARAFVAVAAVRANLPAPAIAFRATR